MIAQTHFPGAIMLKPFTVGVLLLLAGCAVVPRPGVTASPCDVSQASYECQVERYNNVGVQ
jgi:hypothetical protein